MIGSEKQIAWAEKIKAGMEDDFAAIMDQVSGNEHAVKTIEFIQNIEHASFWISYRKNVPTDMLREICSKGLRLRGNEYSHKATVDQTTGKITITWTEIVSDGKGGHKETMAEEI